MSARCPKLPIRMGSATPQSISVISKIKLAAYESLQEDDAIRTDVRMATEGRRFMECDGVDILYATIGRMDKLDEHVMAADARQAKKSLHRSAYPLARFLSVHIANQQNRLGAEVGRRMIFAKMVNGRILTLGWLEESRSSRKSMVSNGTQRHTRPHRRIRSSWHVSPMLFQIIVAYTKDRKRDTAWNAHTTSETKGMVGGRWLGTGRNDTRVYTFDDIAREHPLMRSFCMHMYGHPQPESGMKPVCFSGRDAEHVVRLANSSMSNVPIPFLDGVALKDVKDDEDAGTELHAHQRIHRWFSEVHSIHLTCLHPQLHYLELDETDSNKLGLSVTDVGTRTGHRLLVTHLKYGDVHYLNLREDEIYELSVSVLQALIVFHEHHHLHMDIKPENILWDLDAHGQKRVFCLSDYNLMMSDANVLHHLRPDDGGGFQSLSHGTEGYKSPLLMQDDTKGSTYQLFEKIAKKTRSFTKKRMPVWRDYFDKARSSTSMAKVDLHSLALTLERLGCPKGQDSGEQVHLLHGPFGKFLAKLMFFRPHDFKTARDALNHLEFKSVKKSKRGYNSLHV